MSNDVPSSRSEPQLPDVIRPKLPPRPVKIAPLNWELTGSTWIGIFIVVLFFGGGGLWAATAPISGAAIAPGFVSPDSSRQTVQHFEGGIIREIRVREGDSVEKGSVLVVLEDVQAQAEVGALMTRLRSLAAAEARLLAERRNQREIAFDHWSLEETDNPEVSIIIDQQINQFDARRANLESREGILKQRIAQLKEQIIGTERQIASLREQQRLINLEIRDVSVLLEKGLARRPRLLALQREKADLLGNEGELLSRIARFNEAVGETELQILNNRNERQEEVDTQLTETQSRRIEVEQQIKESLDRLSRTAIVAPVAGTVLDVRFKTTGGVIRPGEEVLDIVPAEDDLIIDARISPQDIDTVHAGLDAYVMFPSYPQRNMPRIEGQLVHVSPDSFQDERTGERYYQARVEVDRTELQALAPQIELTPGLPAEVFIETIERTLLDYLLQPVMFVVERSFREQ